MKAKYILLYSVAFFYGNYLKAQSNDDILNLLIQKGAITQNDADSLRADYAVKQQDKVRDKLFRIDLEFRPRAEYRNGFQQLRPDSSIAAFFIGQRSRLSFTYEQLNKFRFHTSLQDVRVWGAADPRSLAGSVQVFEAYAEPFITSNFSVRVGRQKLAFDNQRLFAENDWRLNAGSHDALNFRYISDKIISELALAFNQTTERLYGTDFTPVGFTNYKSLGVHYLVYKLGRGWTVSTINAADGYQDVKVKEKIHQRFTDGGRIEFEKSKLYVTASGYYQSGKSSIGKNINAWYAQPEIRFTIPQNILIRLGAEVFSGDNGEAESTSDHNFIPLYGVAHRFNGSMELFTNKPKDFGNAGLVNPYLFMIKNAGPKVELRADFHLFYSQNNYVYKSETISKYLGFENDLLFTYRPNAYTKFDLGFSYALPTKSLEIIKKSGKSIHVPTWAYISITLKPQLFKANF